MTTKRKTPKKVTTQNVSRTPEVIFDENHSLLYANSVQIQMSLYDFNLIFGMVGGIKNGRVQIAALQTIIISPQHAKELAKVLTENVQKYEEKFMALPIRRKIEGGVVDDGKDDDNEFETEIDEP